MLVEHPGCVVMGGLLVSALDVKWEFETTGAGCYCAPCPFTPHSTWSYLGLRKWWHSPNMPGC